MKVSKLGSPKEARFTRKKKAMAADGAFADNLKGTTTAAELDKVVEGQAIGGVDSILAVQEVPGATDGRGRGMLRRYGDDLLSRLDDLRIGILSGAYPKQKLVDLAHRLRKKRQASDDPRLNEIIEEIELRAEVEIAKLTRGA